MFSKLQLILSLLLCAEGSFSKESHCVLRDVCGKFPKIKSNNNLVCVYEDEAMDMAKPHRDLLAKVCPHFELEVASKVCCSRKQIKALQDNLLYLQKFVGHCPSCFHNLKKLFCDFTCHPKQNTFLYPSEIEKKTNLDGEEVKIIRTLDYYVDISFVNGIFDACKDVLFPSQTGSILPYICGPNVCTPKRLLQFMGASSPQSSPIDIQFMFSDEPETGSPGFIYYNPGTVPCNVPILNESSPCSCANCELSCPVLDFDQYQSQSYVFEIGKADGLSVVMGVIFVVFTAGFIGSIVFLKKKST